MDVQFGECVGTITADEVTNWVSTALPDDKTGSICIRFLDANESRQLNRRYRSVDRPTNVLAFEANEENILGDIAVCVPTAMLEAKEQNKPLTAHLAHLVVHGTLHLCGFDHTTSQESQLMEGREIRILAKLGFDNPYELYG